MKMWKTWIRGKVVEVKDSDDKLVVAWTGFESSDRPLTEQRANAKLIAAAPKMLLACEEAAHWLTHHSCCPDDPQQQRVVRFLQEAIADIPKGVF